MTVQANVAIDNPSRSHSLEVSGAIPHGLAAGLLGAAIIAVWFLILDWFNGRPLYTPTVLGTVLFRHGEGLQALESLPVSVEVAMAFTWVQTLICAAVGGAASWLLSVAERNPSVGFGVLLLFVVGEFAFLAVAMILAEPVLHALAWPSVLVANLLAVAAMVAYFRLQQLDLHIRP